MYVLLRLVYHPLTFWNLVLSSAVWIFVTPVCRNSKTLILFAQKLLEWFLCPIYPTCYFFSLGYLWSCFLCLFMSNLWLLKTLFVSTIFFGYWSSPVTSDNSEFLWLICTCHGLIYLSRDKKTDFTKIVLPLCLFC